MVTAEDFECWFHQSVLNSATEPTKEKRMNTYTIVANATYERTYTVEAECEEDALNEVEWGSVEPDDDGIAVEIGDARVVEVEYGDVERSGTLFVNFVTRGDINENNIKDALYTVLQLCDGKVAAYGDGELELVGFSVKDVNEKVGE